MNLSVANTLLALAWCAAVLCFFVKRSGFGGRLVVRDIGGCFLLVPYYTYTMTIVKRFEIPNGGWRFEHPVTGMKFPTKSHPTYSLDDMIRDIRSHERANKLDGYEDLESGIARQCCLPREWVTG
jgi:hypothetical protein